MKRWPLDGADWLAGLGIVCLLGGVGWIYWPAAVILVGASSSIFSPRT